MVWGNMSLSALGWPQGRRVGARWRCCGPQGRTHHHCVCAPVSPVLAGTECLCAGGGPRLAAGCHHPSLTPSKDRRPLGLVLVIFIAHYFATLSLKLFASSLTPFPYILLIPCDLKYIHRFIMNLFGANGILSKHKRKGWVSLAAICIL